MVSAIANRWPPSAPIRSEEKNSPPRNPQPSEAIEATIFSTKSSATARNDRSSMPATRNAPWPDDIELGRRKMLRHQKTDQRRDADRRERGGRITADDQLKTVERAGQRRAERAGNAGGGAATDQDAQVAAAQAKG